MTRPSWLDGDYESALRMVAERATLSRAVGGLVKNAALAKLAGLDAAPLDVLRVLATEGGEMLANPRVQKLLRGQAAVPARPVPGQPAETKPEVEKP